MKRHIVCHLFVTALWLLVCPVVQGGPAEPPARPTYASVFTPGTRVELLEDAPAVGPGLEAGMSGIIVCCDAADCSAAVLVSWHVWRGGIDDETSCAEAGLGLYPSGSTTWVDPSRVRLAVPFDKVGTIEERPEGCLYLATDDGGLFHIATDPEFREQWWVVRAGNYIRLRGLLDVNTAAGGGKAACDPAGGTVYHPIMSLLEWEASCCSRCTRSFEYGDRVVLIGRSNPNGAPDLPRGATGTIICCNPRKEQRALVSWDLWDQGGEADAYLECVERLYGLFPPGSTWWVSAEDLAEYFASDCGVLEKTRLCCADDCADVNTVGLFVPVRDVYCLPDIRIDGPVPTGPFRALGLLSPYEGLLGLEPAPSDDSALSRIGGIVFDSLVIPCPEPSCCEPPYVPGERVSLLVDQPGGAPDLPAGTAGTVICCNSQDPIAPILVSWDDWAGGHDDNEACETTPRWYPEDSAWWVACAEIQRIVLPDLYDKEAFHSFSPEVIEVGKHLRIAGMIGNRGGADSGPFVVSIRLSPDRDITADDYAIGQVAMALEPGASAPILWLQPLPADVPPGSYYVGWLIDPENRVKEADEQNNTAVIASGQLTVTGG